jgi:UDP-N-acetylmuramoylalanine--D-glutamate ligase
VFLNFSSDHLDRHAGIDDYLNAKLRLFEHQSAGDVAVLNAAEPVLSGRTLGGAARRVWFGEGADCELRRQQGRLLWQGRPLMNASEIRLRGAHNVENAMAAAAATLARGVEPDAVRAALAKFQGVPHRLEEVARVGGVLYVNDSKATNISAALAALGAFEGGVHAVLGGSLKGGGFERLAPAVSERCEACYLIGEAADRLSEDLASSGVELVRCGDLERAVSEASRRARSGQAVLLAPACASFDQYRDFEQRGEHFRALVHEIEEAQGEAGGAAS